MPATVEWIICQNVCSKENWRIRDLFIGRGSDGKWYYSTFHFCVGRVVLKIEPQPETLAELVDKYWLVAFDRDSEECLNKTWEPGNAWGSYKQPQSPGVW